MKYTLVLSICVVVVLAGIMRCKKSTDAPAKNLATCTTCNGALLAQTPDTVTGLWYYLPTAFTPNGDGINDVFHLTYSSLLNEDSSKITIWDKNGNGVFEGTINQVWNGNDLSGHLCPAGHYPLYMQLRTIDGTQINQCGCVSILTYKGACIYTGGVTYYYPDEIDTANGFTYPTNDHICP